MSQLRLPPLSLYIHLPWCTRKCPYCDFNSHAAENFPERDYVAALLADLARSARLALGRPLLSVFFGGGTPSLFSAGAIGRILDAVRARLELAPGAEITLEANPGSAEAEKFQAFREAGVNRLSLGVQSFHDASLAALGRVHDGGQARRALRAALDAGFDSVNIDLMHGLPGQAPQMARGDLQQAAASRVPHISWYQLAIEPNTEFHKRRPNLPGERILWDIQTLGERLLAGEGYRNYEISAWSLPGHACLHNLNYWRFGDYLGIGAGAHSKWSDPRDGTVKRASRIRRPERYLRQPGPVRERTLRADDLVAEYMMNALRLSEGFCLAAFSARTGLPGGAIADTLESLAGRELLEERNRRLRATELGRRHLDTLLAEFLRG